MAKGNKAVLVVSKLDRLSRKVSFTDSLIEDKDLDFKVAQMPYADKFQLHIYADCSRILGKTIPQAIHC